MDIYGKKEIAKKILSRDYNRWIQYVDECVNDRASYTKSFHSWKEDNGLIEKDADDLAELL